MPTDVQVSSHTLGAPRMQRYLSDCDGDPTRAHHLYIWNVRMAGALFEAMHLFEVMLRNGLDSQLRPWNESMGAGPDWLMTPHPYLASSLHLKVVEKAKRRASMTAAAKGRVFTHDDVLAQMPLGTWRYLLPSRASAQKRKLWTEATCHAFPLWPGPWQHLVARVEAIHDLRNRVAHLEPVHRLDLRYSRRAMRDVCHAMSWQSGRLFTENERLLPLIDSAPTQIGDQYK